MNENWTINRRGLEKYAEDAMEAKDHKELAKVIVGLCSELLGREQQMLTMIKRASELPDLTAAE